MLILEEISKVAEEAHKLGLTYAGWNKWKNAAGEETHKTVKDKLVRIPQKVKKFDSKESAKEHLKYDGWKEVGYNKFVKNGKIVKVDKTGHIIEVHEKDEVMPVEKESNQITLVPSEDLSFVLNDGNYKKTFEYIDKAAKKIGNNIFLDYTDIYVLDKEGSLYRVANKYFDKIKMNPDSFRFDTPKPVLIKVLKDNNEVVKMLEDLDWYSFDQVWKKNANTIKVDDNKVYLLKMALHYTKEVDQIKNYKVEVKNNENTEEFDLSNYVKDGESSLSNYKPSNFSPEYYNKLADNTFEDKSNGNVYIIQPNGKYFLYSPLKENKEVKSNFDLSNYTLHYESSNGFTKDDFSSASYTEVAPNTFKDVLTNDIFVLNPSTSYTKYVPKLKKNLSSGIQPSKFNLDDYSYQFISANKHTASEYENNPDFTKVAENTYQNSKGEVFVLQNDGKYKKYSPLPKTVINNITKKDTTYVINYGSKDRTIKEVLAKGNFEQVNDSLLKTKQLDVYYFVAENGNMYKISDNKIIEAIKQNSSLPFSVSQSDIFNYKKEMKNPDRLYQQLADLGFSKIAGKAYKKNDLIVTVSESNGTITQETNNTSESFKELIEELKEKPDLSSKIAYFDSYPHFSSSEFPELTDDEKKAIYIYTTNTFESINDKLRNNKGNLPIEVFNYVKLFDQAVDKLPVHSGEIVYRRARLPRELRKSLEVGKVFMDTGISSSSTIDKRQYGDEKANLVESERTIFIIKHKSGRYIAPISAYKSEEEVVFKSRRPFLVNKIEGCIVHVTELETDDDY